MARRSRRELSPATRGAIYATYALNSSYQETATQYGVSRSAVQSTVQHYEQTGSHQTRSCTGRPHILSPRDQRIITCTITRNRYQTYSEIAKIVGNVTTSQVL